MPAFNKLKSNQTGVTLVEMLTVMAISALVIAGIALTIPGLRRAQRNDERRRDIAYVESQLLAFQFATDGALPSTVAEMTKGVTSVKAESAIYAKRSLNWSNANSWHETLSTATRGTTQADKYDFWVDDGTAGAADDDTDPGFAGGSPAVPDPLPNEDVFDVFIGFRCESRSVLAAGPNYNSNGINGFVREDGNSGDYAIVYKLEGNDLWRCQSSSYRR